ncbi:MAG: hypothetical protein WBG86_00555 [Polyangiales bacterium]
MNETMLKLRIWARAEATLGRANARHAGRRMALAAIAVGLALLTVGMINFGAYESLAEAYGKAKGAFVLGGVNALLATLVALAAQRPRSAPEEAMVQEIREMAMAELAADADLVRAEVQRITGHVQRIEDGLSAISNASSSGVAMMASVGPVVEMIVQALKHRKSQSDH